MKTTTLARLLVTLGDFLAVPLTATAQSTFTYRGQVTAEAAGTLVNPSSPLVPAGAHGWTDSSLFVAAGAGSWQPSSRLKLAGGLALTGSHGGDIHLRLREG